MLRTHEVHPTLVHFPLALVPTALTLDAIGFATGNEALMKTGKTLMPWAAASAAVAGAAGYIAQSAVKAEGHAHDMLVTHRNLNTALVAATAALAVVRQRTEQPGIGYLLAGCAGLIGMTYTAYLGGKMVYAQGVGVEPHGVDIERSPEIRPRNARRVATQAFEQGREQVLQSAREVRAGEIAPELLGRRKMTASGARHMPPTG